MVISHMRIGIHYRRLLLLTALIGASGAAQATCTDIVSCTRAAQAALQARIQVWNEAACGNTQGRGCLIISDAGNQRRTQSLPENASMASTSTPPHAYLVQNDKSRDIRFLPLNIDLGTMGENPGGGSTVVMIYYTDAPRDPDKLYTLFSAAFQRAGKAPLAATMVAFGIKGNKLLVGRGGPVGQDRSHWLPLWDPSIPATPDTPAWVALAATFQKDGKLRVDQVHRPDGARPVTMQSSLIETGWPITAYPDGRQPKTFLPANKALLGSMDYSDDRLAAPVPPGLGGVHLFRRALTPQELRGWIETALHISLNPRSPYTLTPCNTGRHLNGSDRQEARAITVCGNKESPAPEILSADRPYTLAVTADPEVNLEAGMPGEPVRTARGHCGPAYPMRQQWTVVKREALRKLGPGNYILFNEATNTVLTERGGRLYSETLIEPQLAPAQIWHAYYPTDSTAQGFRLLSSSSGMVLTVRQEGDSYQPMLDAPEKAQWHPAWYIAPFC